MLQEHVQTSPAETVEPAFSVPPHFEYEGLAAWITSPPGAVVQFTRPMRYSIEQAQWLVGPGYAALDRRFPGGDKLTLVLDMSLMIGRSASARAMFLAKARASVRRFGRGGVVLPRTAGAALTFSVRGTAALIQAVGIQVEVFDSIAQGIARYQLRPDQLQSG